MFKNNKIDKPKTIKEKPKVTNQECKENKVVVKIKDCIENPAMIFRNDRIAARFFCYAFFIMTFIAIIQPIPYFVMINNRERVAIIGQDGSTIITPILDFKKAENVHMSIAKMATRTLLNRNPKGLDEPDLLKQLFLQEAYIKATNEVANQDKQFKREEFHQKCEILSVDLLQQKNGSIVAQVKGQLIRTGSYKGNPVVESYSFTLNLQMLKNPSLGENLRLPYAINQYKLIINRMEK